MVTQTWAVSGEGHSGIWIGDKDHVYSFYEFTRYQKDADYKGQKYKNLYIAEGQLADLKELGGIGGIGLRKLTFDTKKDLDAFLAKEKFNKQTVFNTTLNEDNTILRYIEHEAGNPESKEWLGKYNLLTNNCAQFVLKALDKVGINFKDHAGEFFKSLIMPIPLTVESNSAPNKLHERLDKNNRDRIKE